MKEKEKEKKTTSVLRKKNGRRTYYGVWSGKLSLKMQHINPVLKDEKELTIVGM